ITEHIDKKDPYSDVVKVISVNILYFDLGRGEDYVYHGTTRFEGIHSNDILQLSEDQQELYKKDSVHQIFPEYYLIKVKNFNDVAKSTLDEWIYFLKNEEIKENFSAKGLKKAKKELDILKLPERERLAYERYQDDLHYQASMVESSYTIGVMKGEKRGIAQGIEQGIEQGIVQGMAEGEKQKAMEIARNLIDVLDLRTIALKTGLTEQEIVKLKSL
ncbi:MAG: PD-(D/E)XK nuclease family transposase, partial [Desulfocapsa sp.]|nr:PD-(D/E)XK nuclease family transposase [Desulfocapsa sp.]